MSLFTPENARQPAPSSGDLKERAAALSLLFRLHSTELRQVISYAVETREAIHGVDSFIQDISSKVCPECREVCCINRHAYYDSTDLVYTAALGAGTPSYRAGVKDSAPCQFLSPRGCTIARALRPFRCTWYFCEPLLIHMGKGPAKPLRQFSSKLQGIIDMRREMMEEFSRILQSHSWPEKGCASLYTKSVKSKANLSCLSDT